MWHANLEGTNNMHPLSRGGTNGKGPEIQKVFNTNLNAKGRDIIQVSKKCKLNAISNSCTNENLYIALK